MNQNLAMVFPGQGSQSLGMVADLSKNYPQIEQVFSIASEVLGYDLWQLTQQDPEHKLNQTEYTQPALLAADYAIWQCWQAEQGPQPTLLAGHSLGEYSALVCAEVLTFVDAIWLVSRRGHYMQNAVAEGQGAMAAIIGLDEKMIKQLCNEVAEKNEILAPANYNTIGQTVVAGHKSAVERVLTIAKQKGAALAKLIPVSVPSHCQLMKDAAEAFAVDLKKISLDVPLIPIIHNFDVGVHTDPEQIRQVLTAQLTNPVRWVETIQYMLSKGIEFIVECGPGKVLTGLNKRIDANLNCYSLADYEQFKIGLEKVTKKMESRVD